MFDNSYQSMQKNMLRQAIREILLAENYNVSIVGTPIVTKKKKRGEKPPEEIVANVVLGNEDLMGFIDMMNKKDLLNTAATEADDEITRRIKEIESRAGPTAAKLALSSYQNIKDDSDLMKIAIYNLPGEDGAALIEHPKVGETYEIPEELYQLAQFGVPASGDDNVGKGEVLAILMFGRETDAEKEPDLIVSDKLKFSVKSFDRPSSTVRFSAGLSDQAENTDRLIELTKNLRDLAGKTDTWINRLKMRTILEGLKESYKGGEEGAPSRQEVLDLIEECGTLWDTLPVSIDPVLSLLKFGGKNRFEVISKDPDVGVRLGVVRLEGNIPKLEIASPAYSNFNVKVGSNPERTAKKEG